jgi:hypothetical protein
MLSTSIGSCLRRRGFPCPGLLGISEEKQVLLLSMKSRGSLLSAVKQERREKADQDPDHRAENSEPEGNVPGGASGDRDFAREYFWKSCHESTLCLPG